MKEVFNLISKLRKELENCRNGANDTEVMNAVQTVNAIDNKLLKANEASKPESNCNLQSFINPLGVATTIGELKKIIQNYPDETSFGFRNQPMQELHEVKYPDVVFVVFQ